MSEEEKRIFRYRFRALLIDCPNSEERIKYAKELLKEIDEEVSTD